MNVPLPTSIQTDSEERGVVINHDGVVILGPDDFCLPITPEEALKLPTRDLRALAPPPLTRRGFLDPEALAIKQAQAARIEQITHTMEAIGKANAKAEAQHIYEQNFQDTITRQEQSDPDFKAANDAAEVLIRHTPEKAKLSKEETKAASAAAASGDPLMPTYLLAGKSTIADARRVTTSIGKIYLPQIMQRMCQVAVTSKDERAAIAAANFVSDRVLGKPTDAPPEDTAETERKKVDIKKLLKACEPEELAALKTLFGRIATQQKAADAQAEHAAQHMAETIASDYASRTPEEETGEDHQTSGMVDVTPKPSLE